jgi:uncharacterized membrane protein
MTTRTAREEGSVLVLTLGFAVVIMLFVGVVVDASKLFLTRRALASVADGAALAAAQDVDVGAVYRGTAGGSLPISAPRAVADVTRYVAEAAAQTGLTDLHVLAVQVDGTGVTVSLGGRAMLPLVGVVTGTDNGVDITVTARAQSAVSR